MIICLAPDSAGKTLPELPWWNRTGVISELETAAASQRPWLVDLCCGAEATRKGGAGPVRDRGVLKRAEI